VTHCPPSDVVFPLRVAFLGVTDKIVGGRKYSNKNEEKLVPSLVAMFPGTIPGFIEGGAMTTA